MVLETLRNKKNITEFENLESLLNWVTRDQWSDALSKNYYQFQYEHKEVSSEKETVIYVNIPAMRAENLAINVTENKLNIQYTGDKNAIFNGGKLNLTYNISNSDTSGVTSEYRDGVLEVHIPRAPKNTPRKIEVKLS
jgi:HSP20 family molecular chaperone IbpA